ncbi:MAG: methionyl-tRNA formyltransferase [Candidatus Cloacimonadaceae bacterium]|jgi:methionyl-tRNA formyltransferase|nr:methionyl-tRNA formyltransferase [Candidatus Cloacimonadota bacterium]MDY0127856.1 methionyl-tRNA formyltransferase [Candidatus Cloacimonadaceae bacterium]MCB5255312.1 methionyl-tRNA formyltransferase [Candidatus Cloacimonadota bacterium]MCK9178361.1 methionyl-tRNA formyltransferase [Candidatus Cloacimonadota bacterium]MCK9242136.1 methionyl-tRNA formyltransferase [Candidatus Cloacimonadota bacterium]
MKIVFAGSSEFAIPALKALLSAPEHELVLVLSQPPSPQGRRQKLEDTPLAKYAREHSLNIFCPQDVNSEQNVDDILSHKADILITASYGAYLKRRLRQSFALGALNLHPSLLPLYRGASPIRAALLNGDRLSGNTIFKIVARMDAGPVFAQESLKIQEGENYSSLHDRLALQAADMLVGLLPDLPDIQPREQDHAVATFCQKVGKEDLLLDFGRDSLSLQNQIRAYSQSPGAFVRFRDAKLKILQAEPLKSPSELPPGSISEIIKNEGFTICTKDGQLLIRQVQAAGKKIMDAYSYHLGARLQVGERIGV